MKSEDQLHAPQRDPAAGFACGGGPDAAARTPGYGTIPLLSGSLAWQKSGRNR